MDKDTYLKKKLIEPINFDKDGCAFTVCTRYGAACMTNLWLGGGHYPMSGAIEYEPSQLLDNGQGTDECLDYDSEG